MRHLRSTCEVAETRTRRIEVLEYAAVGWANVVVTGRRDPNGQVIDHLMRGLQQQRHQRDSALVHCPALFVPLYNSAGILHNMRRTPAL